MIIAAAISLLRCPGLTRPGRVDAGTSCSSASVVPPRAASTPTAHMPPRGRDNPPLRAHEPTAATKGD